MKLINRPFSLMAICVVACMLALIPDGRASTGVPFNDGFESYALGTLANGTWTNTGDGSVTIQTAQKAAGSKACLVDGDTLTVQAVSTNSGTNVWITFHSKPSVYDDSVVRPDLTNATAAFYVNGDGELHAYVDNNGAAAGGDEWVQLATGLPTNAWLGFSAHLDYARLTWDLYYTTGAVESVMQKANDLPLRFSTQYSNRLGQISIQADGPTYVDQVGLARGVLTVVDGTESPSNVVASAGTTIGRGLAAGSIAAYFDDRTDGLTGDLGAALRLALNVGDTVQVYDTATQTWGTYLNLGNAWATQSGPDHNGVRITRTTPVWINSAATGTVEIAVFRPNDDPSPTNVVVFGTAAATAGWTPFQWPYASARSVNDTSKGLGFSELNNDYMWIYDQGRSNYQRQVYWTSDARWHTGLNQSTNRLHQGQGFWYYRTGAANALWDVRSVE